MKQALMINGKDAYEKFGVCMGESFLETILQPLTPKDPIINESRIEDGKRVTLPLRKFFAARDITLTFTIEGRDMADFSAKRAAFLEEMYEGKVEIQIPAISEDIYRLVYLGFGTTYGYYPDQPFCNVALKFTEPNPRNRGLSESDQKIV